MRLSEWLIHTDNAKAFMEICGGACGYSARDLSAELSKNAYYPFAIERILGKYCFPSMKEVALNWRAYLRKNPAHTKVLKCHLISSKPPAPCTSKWTKAQLERLQQPDVIMNRNLDEGVLK